MTATWIAVAATVALTVLAFPALTRGARRPRGGAQARPGAPEYEVDPMRGLVRWRIASGLLVAKRGRRRDGYLQIEVRRQAQEHSDRARLHVEVEVANYYPAIAFGFSRRIYDATQSHIHVLVTHGFLRSLARLDLAESRVGLLAPDDAIGGRG